MYIYTASKILTCLKFIWEGSKWTSVHSSIKMSKNFEFTTSALLWYIQLWISGHFKVKWGQNTKVFLHELYLMNYLLLIEWEVLIQEAFEQFQLGIFGQAAFVTVHSVRPLILLPFSAKDWMLERNSNKYDSTYVGHLFICCLSLGSRFPHSYVVLFTLEQIIGKYFSIGFYSLCVAELEISNKKLNFRCEIKEKSMVR